MSLIHRCDECGAKLPNQYAPLGGKCGGYECVKLDADTTPIFARLPEAEQLTECRGDPLRHLEPRAA